MNIENGKIIFPRGNEESRRVTDLIIEELQLQMADRAGVRISDAELNLTLSRLAANNQLSLEANSPDTGSASEEIEISYVNEEMSIGFNAKYLLDVTSQVGSGDFNISLKDEYSPFDNYEDYLIEDILQRSFSEGSLEKQDYALDFNIDSLYNHWKVKK